MEKYVPQRNLHLPPLLCGENYVNEFPALSSPGSSSVSSSIAAQNLPENLYDLVNDLDSLALSSPHVIQTQNQNQNHQFIKELGPVVAQQRLAAFSNGFNNRTGAIIGHGSSGSSSLTGEFDSVHSLVPVNAGNQQDLLYGNSLGTSGSSSLTGEFDSVHYLVPVNAGNQQNQQDLLYGNSLGTSGSSSRTGEFDSVHYLVPVNAGNQQNQQDLLYGNSLGTSGSSSLTGEFDSVHSLFPVNAGNQQYQQDLLYGNSLNRMQVVPVVREQMDMYTNFQGPIDNFYAYAPVGGGLINSPVGLNLNPTATHHEYDREINNRYNVEFGGYTMPTLNRNGFDKFGRYSENRCWLQRGYNFTSLEELKGNIYLVAKDRRGCRFLQRTLEIGKPEEFLMIYSEIKDHVKELMVDSFANYFIQRLFLFCRSEQITQLLVGAISDQNSLIELCGNSCGTRTMQRLIENITTPEQRSLLVSALVHITVPLIKCTNGNHVIQHCLKRFPFEDNKYILNVVAGNCLDIATDRSGCCVLKQCISLCISQDDEGGYGSRLLADIIANAVVLSEDPYGNYVVQFVLEKRIARVTSPIIGQLKGRFVSLSMNKHGSYVVEKCLKESSENQAMLIIREIIYDQNFKTVIEDDFGNYVAQAAFAIAKGPLCQEMVRLIWLHYSASFHNNLHVKRILGKARACRK